MTRTSSRLLKAARDLLGNLQSGWMSETAYDTAWLARVPDPRRPSRPAFPSAMRWLIEHQREDGSWGATTEVLHDRVVSTVAALVALAERSRGKYADAIARGEAHLGPALGKLRQEPFETVGFELIMPPLLARARELGLALRYDDAESIHGLRAAKLHRLPPGFVYTQPSSLTHSLEFLGGDLQVDLVKQCQAENGSYGASPSATAYVLSHRWDVRAASYLRAVMALSDEGGVCNVYPFEIFEKGWVLHHLAPMGRALAGRRPHLAALAAAWTPGGTSFTTQGMVPDGDDTAVVFKVLRSHRLPIQPQVLKLFEAEDYFFCFSLERNQSVSTNAHMLDALKDCAELADQKQLIAKAVRFLEATKIDGRYWRDKWHVSAYYATCHTLLALGGAGMQAEQTASNVGGWLLETQHANGSWSELDANGTCEETAYGLQALLTLPETGVQVKDAADRAASYLWERFDEEDYPELWAGKGLYTPYAVVRAAILGALYRYEQMRHRWLRHA